MPNRAASMPKEASLKLLKKAGINRPVQLLPNLVTTAALSCGLLAIYNMVGHNEDSTTACWFILAAAVLDAIDGAVARMTRSESDFGVQYDSLSDAIVFGTTPAILIFLHLRGLRGPEEFVGKFAQFSCMMFTICGVLRLARFNVATNIAPKKTFTGMPIPGAAATVVSCYLAVSTIDNSFVVRLVPFLMLFLALAMVSRFEYHSFKSIELDKPRSFETLLVAIAFLALAFVFKKHLIAHIEWIVFSVMLLYALSGPILHFGRGAKFEYDEEPPDWSESDGAPAPQPAGAAIREVAPRRAPTGSEE
jgi:CDP-diacylglycerol--serine O-phosphatidyltransferase